MSHVAVLLRPPPFPLRPLAGAESYCGMTVLLDVLHDGALTTWRTSEPGVREIRGFGC